MYKKIIKYKKYYHFKIKYLKKKKKIIKTKILKKKFKINH